MNCTSCNGSKLEAVYWAAFESGTDKPVIIQALICPLCGIKKTVVADWQREPLKES